MSNSTLQATDDLPPLLSEIASVIGRDAALEIAKAVGGTRVYFPKTSPDGHWLTACIGRASADKLCSHLSVGRGIWLSVPLGPASPYRQRQQQRREAIRSDIAAGLSARDIALKHRMTERRVRQHRKSLREKG